MDMTTNRFDVDGWSTSAWLFMLVSPEQVVSEA